MYILVSCLLHICVCVHNYYYFSEYYINKSMIKQMRNMWKEENFHYCFPIINLNTIKRENSLVWYIVCSSETN